MSKAKRLFVGGPVAARSVADLIADAEATIAALGGTNPATVDDLAAQRDTWEATARQLAAAGTGRLADASEPAAIVAGILRRWLINEVRLEDSIDDTAARIVAALDVGWLE